MTRQLLFGKNSAGSVVLKVAKPGYDPDTTNPGNLLFDSQSQAYQTLASGTQFIENCWAASPSSGGSVSRSVTLGIGSYSNVALWFDVVVNITYSDGSLPNDSYVKFIQETLDLRAVVSGGVLFFSATNVPYYNQTQVKPQVNSNWFAFRSQYA